MPNLLPLEHLTFASQVPAPKLMAKAHERARRRRPNSSWQITELRTTPTYGNPKNRIAAPDLFNKLCLLGHCGAQDRSRAKHARLGPLLNTKALRKRDVAGNQMRHPSELTELTELTD